MRGRSVSDDPIAIVGMGGRFPGSPDLTAFWRTVRDGRVHAGPVPGDRWDHDLFYSPTGAREHNKTYAAKLSVVDRVRDFAPEFYGLSPRRAKVMDPQQRLFLDVVRGALEDAGYGVRALPRRRTGVFVGATVSDYMDLLVTRIKATQLGAGEFGPLALDGDATKALTQDLTQLQAYSLVGTLMNMVAADVSQCFDFGGPAFTMDAACSSALVALHEAVLHLRTGLCDAAVVGGVYLILAPDNMVAFARIGALSASDACRPFDRRADGFVIGEGIGAVVLRRLSDAQAAGDRIYAVIRGVGMNNDGRAEGPMTPRKEGQIDALDRAYEDAGVDPRTIETIEAHGTATPVGDATELAALGEFRGGPGARPCAVTSVKANIGHSMSAAGISGLIRATLGVHRRAITPQANYAEDRDELQLQARGFHVPRRLTSWDAPTDHPRRAGVNSFGFGGTNVHVVLEEAPTASARPDARVSVPLGDFVADGTVQATAADEPELFVLAAPNDALLATYAAELRQSVEDAPDAALAEIALTLAGRRTDAVRAAFVASSRAELLSALSALASERQGDDTGAVRIERASTPAVEAGQVAFLFPGQGAQAPDLGRDLYERFPTFRKALDELARRPGPEGKTLLDWLYPRNGSRASAMSVLTRTEVCQPIMAALGLALSRFLGALGVQPGLVTGHSLGEFAAAAAAGILDDGAVVDLVADRGRMIAALPLADKGAMAAVAADRATVTSQLKGLAGQSATDGVVVANANHPGQTVISGPTPGIDKACERLAAAGLKTTRLRVSHAFHSPLMKGLRPAFEQRLASLQPRTARLPVLSAVAAGPYPDTADGLRTLLANHATAPVDFVSALEDAARRGARIFVQMGGGQALAGMARATLGAAHPRLEAFTVAGDVPDEGRTFLQALARLYALGLSLDLAELFEGRPLARASLPPSPLESRPFWAVRREPGRDAVGSDSKESVRSDAVAPKLRPAMAAPPRVDHPLSATDGTTALTDPAPIAVAGGSALASLFQQQVAVLEAHLAIIRQQNDLLARNGLSPGALPHPTSLPATASIGHLTGGAVATAVTASETTAGNGHSNGHSNGHGSHAPAAAPAGAPALDVVEPTVVAAVARISASPIERLKGTTRLGGDLGFDSLMVVELASQLAEDFPGLGMLPKTLFARDLTIHEVARHVVATLATSAREPVSDAPARRFDRFRVGYVDARLPAVTGTDAVAGSVLVLGDGALAAMVVERLGAAGVVARAASESDLTATDQATGLPLAANANLVDLRGLVGGAPFESLEAVQRPFMSALATARLLAEHRPAGWLFVHTASAGAGIVGLSKSLAREWDGALVRAVEMPDDASAVLIADRIVGELLSADSAAEVRYQGDARLVPAFTPSPVADGEPIARGSVAVITGGAGAIGRLLSRELVQRFGVKVALLGRRAADESIAAFVAELTASGGQAIYVACDVRSAESVRDAVAQARQALGPVNMAIHAAGVVRDAPVERKDDDGARLVFETKLGGAMNLWSALAGDPLRVFLGLGSWAGRFGNSHQSDYAAANGALARWAQAVGAQPVGKRAGVRVTVLDLPPWQGAGMASQLPEAVRRELERRVPFLSEAEGVSRLVAELAGDSGGNAGESLIGPERIEDLAPPPARLWQQAISPRRSPYLLDHQIDGRPVLPLAAAVARLSAAHRTTTGQAVGAPITMRDVSVIDGIVLESASAEARAAVRATRVRGDQVELELLRTDGRGRLAVRALGSHAGPVAPLHAPPAGAPGGLPLATFYDDHTFHGPLLHAIRAVHAVGAGHVLGSVCALAIDGERPLVAALDGALQLAAYWAVAQHGRGGLPVAIAELHLLREPEAGEELRCVGLLRPSDGDNLAGDIDLLDARGSLVIALRGFRAELRAIGRASSPATNVPSEHVHIAEFPEVRELEQRLQMAAVMGIANPYFRSFEGTNADTATTGGRTLINFSSYNYLGFSGHPDVNKAVTDAVHRYGTSVSASRIASGQRPLHDQLEVEIARLIGTEAAFAMVGGHATNVSVIGHLLGPEDLVVHDSLAHDSILGGVRLSGARRRPFAHNDADALERILKETRAGVRRVLIAVEGVYSMDGDIAPLDRFIEIKKRYGAMLFVDEAHSLGVIGPTGRGVGEHFGINPADVDLWMGTMSKSLASCGGYIAGSKTLVNYLRYTVPGFVYSVGISPANAAAALAAVRLMEKHPELARELQRKSRLFLERCRSRGIDTGLSDGSAVVPCIVGNSYACLQLAQALETRGINVQPILYPAVEENMARLRFFVSVTHSEEQLERTADILGEELRRVVQPTGGNTSSRATTPGRPAAAAPRGQLSS